MLGTIKQCSSTRNSSLNYLEGLQLMLPVMNSSAWIGFVFLENKQQSMRNSSMAGRVWIWNTQCWNERSIHFVSILFP